MVAVVKKQSKLSQSSKPRKEKVIRMATKYGQNNKQFSTCLQERDNKCKRETKVTYKLSGERKSNN